MLEAAPVVNSIAPGFAKLASKSCLANSERDRSQAGDALNFSWSIH